MKKKKKEVHPRLGSDYESLYRHNTQLRKQVDHLSTVREIGLAVSASLELSETLPVIAHVVQGELDIRRLTIFVPDKDADVLRPVIAKYGDDLIRQDRLEEESAPRHGSPLGEALDSRNVVLVEAPGRHEAYVPLIAKGEPVGVMLLENRLDGSPFDSDDVRLFQDLGKQIAIAISNAQLYALAVSDGLTRLYVRRYFDLRMAEEFAQARRYHRVFAVMMFDIDHFKTFNDRHGHQTGDLVLQQFARLLKKNTRQADICCRYGGEEMVVVLPETETQEGAALAQKLCRQIREYAFTGSEGQKLSVTTSIGVAAYRPDFAAAEDMVKAADQALYRAKASGRDRVEVAEGPAP